MNGNQYIKSLDGVRAIAILLVMAFHFEISSYGWMGVQLFFVLSGFLIGGILLNEKDKPGTLGGKLKKFWIRRTLRIFPLYYAFLLLCVIAWFAVGVPGTTMRDLPFLATYTFNFLSIEDHFRSSVSFMPFWSLCVEEQFYLFFPFVVLLLSRRALKIVTIAVLIAGPVFRYLFTLYLRSRAKNEEIVWEAVYQFTPSHLDAFFTGAAIHLFNLKEKVKRPQALFFGSAIFAFALGVISFLVDANNESFIRSLGYGYRYTNLFQQVWYFTPLNILFASLMLMLISKHATGFRNLAAKFLENRVFVEIGKVSYGMYIFHMTIQAYVAEYLFDLSNGNKYWLFFVYAAMVYAVSWVSFRFFESYFIKLKDKLTGTPKTNMPVPDIAENRPREIINH